MYTFHEPKLLTLNTLKNSRYSCVIPIPCEILGGTEYAYKANELIPTPICFQGKKTCLYLYTLQALRQVASKRTGPFCQSPQTTLGSRNPNFTAYIPNYMQLHYGQAGHTQQICQHVSSQPHSYTLHRHTICHCSLTYTVHHSCTKICHRLLLASTPMILKSVTASLVFCSLILSTHYTVLENSASGSFPSRIQSFL